MDRISRERLRIFRMALTISIRQALPLALAIVEAQGVPLDRVVRWLRPTAKGAAWWKARPHLLRHRFARLTLAHYVNGTLPIEDARFRSRYGWHGVVVRKPSHPRGRYAVWTAEGSLNAVAAVGSCVLHVAGPVARLELATSLPLAIHAASVGRPIGDLVGDRLLSDRSWLVTRVTEEKGGTAIEFETGTVPIPPLFANREFPGAERRRSRRSGASTR